MEFMETDQAKDIVMRCHPSVRKRVADELKIVHAILTEAHKNGYDVVIWDSEEAVFLHNDHNQEIDYCFNLDEAQLVLKENNREIGWIYLVFGNDGYDVISDYTTNLESFLKPVFELVDKIENGLA